MNRLTKKLSLIASAATFVLVPTVAMAQTSDISGFLHIEKGPVSLYCSATVELNGPTPETSTEVIGFTLAGGSFGQCIFNTIPNIPHDITQGGGSFTINDFYMDTLMPGDCEGDLKGAVNDGVVTIDAVLSEIEPGTGDCIIVGPLS